ncbi:MAG: LysM peptidoglycan-binding domain-containing protein [Desulfobulbus sp.]|jgi:membrane-bound lytic murein transglycosylase D|uniref:LysM peptidoglycan-binding domain-containing protein n=1 Tax=Desulfobulbus sp. TaxID=895 RepID=UPI00283FAB14|nr:LysM peptidoglycan-binding domain-containing protein [Desulfobulbus sp.]MDR2550118.1 LysM peptidoglycan-binding domain-containing protein [Desulfobulbus sp.]
MKILPNLLTHCLVALLCLSFTACSSHNKKTTQLPPANEVVLTDNQDEEISSAEPEETAAEELEALNAPGAWEYGIGQTYSLEKLGIDSNKYDFPIMVNKQVLYYLELFQGRQRNYFTQWLARSSMYRPHIEAELKKAGLPTDLVFLAMIESGYNPSAYSPAKACGLWQFIEGTGSRYGLKIDSWVDERRQPEKATKAAVQYLSNLYSQFGDWYLAVAAYNAGEKKIDTALKRNNATDFWEIAATEGIFMETKRYVPKLIAAIIIARNPEKYGFTDIAYKKPHEYETITVPGGVSLEVVAATANTSTKELRALNNELRKGQVPPRSEYTLRIPVGTRELIAGNLDKLRPVTTTVYATHTVKKNETLDSICSLYNISKTTLLKANNLRSAQLPRGLRLQIPTTSTKYVVAKDRDRQSEDRLAKNNGKDKRQQQLVKYTLKSGETLASVAKQYRVSPQQILRWNKLSQASKVKPGQQLALYTSFPVPSLAEKPEVRVDASKADTTLTAAATKIAVAKSTGNSSNKPAAVPTLESTKKQSVAKTTQPTRDQKAAQPTVIAQTAKNQPPTWYVVKNGDTLATIAKKFQASPQNIRTWNKLSNNALQTGDKLIVKKG